MTIRPALRVAATAVLFYSFVFARDACGQSVSDVLTFLATNQSVETGNIARDRDAAQATSDTISRALVANLATLPVSSSSGAFVYRLNAELGTVERATQTFGPFFIERALTAGPRHSALGITFQHLEFTSLDGHNLRDGSLVTTANQFVDESTPFDVERLTLDVAADIATLYGSVGLTNRVEIGFAAPMIALRMSGQRVDAYYGRLSTQATASASALGLADLVVRSKFLLFNEPGAGGLAAAVDLRVPTGRREDLLGAGTASIKFTGIGSLETGRVETHANAGVSVGGLARELDYGAAVGVAATERLSLTGELLGRWIDTPGGIAAVSAPHPMLRDVNTIRLVPDASTLRITTVVPGFKWNITDTWVLVGNVSVPLTAAGLTSPITPIVGLDYSFGR
jgi:hypothetical protein